MPTQPKLYRQNQRRNATRVTHVRTICKIAREIFDFLHGPGNLAQLARPPDAIVALDRQRFGISGGKPGEEKLVVRVTRQRPGKSISWEAEAGSLPHNGSIQFTAAPGDEGTEVAITIEYEPTAGKVGAKLSDLTHSGPAAHLLDALRRLKALLEAGEIPTTDGQSVGEPQKSKKKK